MNPNGNEEESDIFAFAYKKSSSLKKRSPDSNQLHSSQEKVKDNEDYLVKNRELIYSKNRSRKKIVKTEETKAEKEKSLSKEVKAPKKESSNPQKAKKGTKKEKNLNTTYKTTVSQEECDYLFKILNDGILNQITETAIRKALNAAGMTDVDDNSVLKMIQISGAEKTALSYDDFKEIYNECKIAKL